jgi:hypothetical protein
MAGPQPRSNLGPSVRSIAPRESKHDRKTHSGGRPAAASARNRLVLGGSPLRARAWRLSVAEAILLYLFLSAVADRHGLSFYSDTTLASRLRLTQPALAQAREELRERDLIAYQLPLVQVLSLPQPGVNRRSEPGRGLTLLGDLFRQAATAATADDRRNTP